MPRVLKHPPGSLWKVSSWKVSSPIGVWLPHCLYLRCFVWGGNLSNRFPAVPPVFWLLSHALALWEEPPLPLLALLLLSQLPCLPHSAPSCSQRFWDYCKISSPSRAQLGAAIVVCRRASPGLRQWGWGVLCPMGVGAASPHALCSPRCSRHLPPSLFGPQSLLTAAALHSLPDPAGSLPLR